MRKKQGQVVYFGDIIQLFHVKSGKYLQVVPGKLAKLERENIDRDGDRILSNAEVYLKVAERGSEYIHSAEKLSVGESDREINCSLEQTSWKLNIFQSSSDTLDTDIILASQLVYINDPEIRCNLTVAHHKIESLSEDDEVTSLLDAGRDEHEVKTYFHKNGDIVLEPPVPPDQINSNFLWIIESSSMLVGGPIKWKTDQVRFKHVNSGQYLRQDVKPDSLHPMLQSSPTISSNISNSVTREGARDEKEYFFSTTPNADSPGTLFNINELNSTGKFLSNAKALQIGQGNVWFERGEVLEGSESTFGVKGTKDKTAALSLIIQCFSGASSTAKIDLDSADEDLQKESAVATVSKEPMDVFVGLSSRHYLRKYYALTEIPMDGDSINTIWPSGTRSDLDAFQRIVGKIGVFAMGYPIAMDTSLIGTIKPDVALRKRRQNLLREQSTLEVVLRMINKLIPMSERAEMAKSQKQSVDDSLLVKMGQNVLSQCFSILFCAVQDNAENQMYVADFMPALLAHLNTQELAVKCVTEMLSKNFLLQETKIGTREIQIFVDKLRSSKMNAMYLQLLQACCSCEGQGVDGNQCKVATMLFSDISGVIVELTPDNNRRKATSWGSDQTLYLKPGASEVVDVRGELLMTQGLPRLTISWSAHGVAVDALTSSSHSPSMKMLNSPDRITMNVEELFDKDGPHKHTASSPLMNRDSASTKSQDGAGNAVTSVSITERQVSAVENRAAVSKYFIAEMFLGAEMCLDRNYVAMHKLDDLFPYEVLVTIVKMEVNDALKAAAVRLLMCLHVDRDPQATSKIPCLTRTWTDIKKYETPHLPYVEKARWHLFGLIQQLISQHVTEMAISPKWTELSWHMLRMLRTLVQFNFYGTNDRMKDVIGPLIVAIDRRKHQAHDSEMQTVKTKKNKGKTAKKVKKVEISLAGGGDTTSKPAPSASFSPEDNTREEDRGETDRLADYTQSGDDTGGIVSRGRNFCQSVATMASNAVQMLYGQDSKVNPEKDSKTDVYRVPSRYSRAPLFELDTMVEAVTILAFAQKVIEDRNISLLLRKFFEWETRVNDKASPMDLFQEVVVESEELTLGVSDFNEVMLDVLMFVHTPLVQSTLEVLMAHHSMRRTLLDNAKVVQLLVSTKRERQYKTVDQMLQQLEQNAETHELWGELETEKHHAQNKQTKDILRELIDICRVRRFVLEFDEEFEADKDIQNLYRNLGAFDICMKVLGLLDSVEEDEDGELSEVALNTRELCLLCNNLLYWFFLGNAKNQVIGYDELDLFLDSLDAEINSHHVITAMFKGNEQLMRQVSHGHLTKLVDKIVKNGKSPHYLALFAAISHVGDRNIVENQLEIVKSLTSPGRLAKVACYFVSVDHPDYAEKRELMRPFLGEQSDLSLDELPPLLAYHLMFLEVLSGCTVGRMNITTVEAKVQSVFSYVDILQSILDPGTITIAKTRLSNFFYNSIIEVELKIPGLEQSSYVWRLLESYVQVLGYAKDELRQVEKMGWESPEVSRQKIEYIIVCMLVTGGFFKNYYDNTSFRFNEFSNSPDKVQISQAQANELIVSLFTKIKDIYDLDSPRLSVETKAEIFSALEALNKSAVKVIYSNLTPTVTNQAATRTEVNTPEGKLLDKFNKFLHQIESDETVQKQTLAESFEFITLLEGLPTVSKQNCSADVRYESLINKLVAHIRENITLVSNQKRLDARATKTSIWIIRAFRLMIENKMEMSIEDRDEDGGAEQDEAAAPVVNALNSCGATALCLDLIADGIDEDLQLEAIKLGVGLLFKEGGALEVQGLMFNHLSKTNSELFFKQVRMTLQKLEDWHNWNKDAEEGVELKTPESILIVRFLQLMCEGHYLPNQDIMREQPNNHVSYNLLDSYVSYLNCLSRIPSAISTEAAVRLTATILEVIQGPCEGNQKHFALDTELVESLNRLNRAKFFKDCDEEAEINLKKTSIDIFQGLLEGQGEKSVVYERVLSVIHLDIIQMMSKKPIMSEAALLEKRPPTEDQVILQTECVVLLQMLCNFKP
eukprot:gene27014-33674_t